MDNIPERLSRTRLLIGDEAAERLGRARVALFGIGGVGGSAAEALIRGGIGALDLIDNDRYTLSNLNRQLFATQKTVGLFKAEAARERLLEIAPDARITAHKLFFTPETAEAVDFSLYDYVIDAIDTVTGKLEIITRAKTAGVPVISCMGTGGKLCPELFEVSDIYSTSVCPLARVMRTELRKRGVESLKVVYSREKPRQSGLFDEKSGKPIPASISFVPPAAGLILAGEVIKDIANLQDTARL